MRLELVNDLPLFQTFGEETLDAELSRTITRLRPALPSVVEFMPFSALTRWWATLRATPAHATVLVGTRPALLHSRDPLEQSRVLEVTAERNLDAHGFTIGATVTAPAALGVTWRRGERIRVVDDVMMSGHTIRSVLAALPPQVRADEVTVNVASRTSLARLAAEHPTVKVTAETVADYEPVVGGTAIFLHDLCHGSLRGERLLNQRDLLRPFFGDDLTPALELRGAAMSWAAGR